MSTTPYCCEHSWREARQAAWKSAQAKSQCLCDPHVEYCNQCFPPEFRPGGAWDQYKPSAPQPPAGEPAVVEAQRELLKRWLDFHTEPAGMTPDIIHNRAAFEAFQDAIEAKSKALIEDTRAALGGDRG